MLHTVRFQRILERSEEIAKENGLECIDSYCVMRAMLDGTIFNMAYITFLRMGINIDHFLEELDKLNKERGPFTQQGGPEQLTSPFVPAEAQTEPSDKTLGSPDAPLHPPTT